MFCFFNKQDISSMLADLRNLLSMDLAIWVNTKINTNILI